MWRFVLRENARNYRDLSARTLDVRRREEFISLAEAAERELLELEEASSRGVPNQDAWLRSRLDAAIMEAVRACNAHFGVVQVYAPESDCLLIAAQFNFSKRELDRFAFVRPGDGSASAAAFTTREAIWIEDVARDERYNRYASVALELGYGALQATPLRVGGTVTGVLSTQYRSPHRWEDAEKREIENQAVRLAALLS